MNFCLKVPKPVVLNPGRGEPQSVLAFVVTQQLIDQWKQLITQLTHLTWSEVVADFKVKTKASTPCSSPGPGLRTAVLNTDQL